jgi:amino-acid N-acetyltransferase
MEIRKAKKRDLPAIHSLILSATKRGKILKRSIQDITKNLKHFWVIEEDCRVIACCSVEIYNKKLAEIRSLVVDHGHEKKGMATCLIEKSIQEAKRRKIYEVLAITDRENLFKRQGFSEQLHGQKALFLRP